MAIFPMLGGGFTFPYIIDYSLIFKSAPADHISLYRTQSNPVTNLKKYSFSVWFKRREFGASFTGGSQVLFAGSYPWTAGWGDYIESVGFKTDDRLWVQNRNGGSGVDYEYQTNVLFQDTDWHHLFVSYDMGNATASQRVRVYVDGSEITSWYVEDHPASDGNMNWAGEYHWLGRHSGDGTNFFEGSIAEPHFVDGQILTPQDFGTFIGSKWVPIEYTGSHGANGFFLDFADTANLGDDESGNINDFTESYDDPTDQSTDTPTS